MLAHRRPRDVGACVALRCRPAVAARVRSARRAVSNGARADGRRLDGPAACGRRVAACGARPAGEVRIPRGAGGVGFLPLLVMEKHGLIEKHAREAGVAESDGALDRSRRARRSMNDALLSGAADYIAAGPPAFITLWDRTRGSVGRRRRGGDDVAADVPEHASRASAHARRRARAGQDRRDRHQGVDPGAGDADVRGAAIRRGRSRPLRQVHRVDDPSRCRHRVAVGRQRASPRISRRRRSISASARTRACARS